MRALVFSRRDLATALAARVDAALGYPRDGVDRGDGFHAPRAASRTLTHADLRAHPARPEWAYPIDAVSEPHLSPAERAAVTTLGPDWIPPSPVFAPDPQHPAPDPP